MIIMYNSICLTLSWKSCIEYAFRTSFGNEFHSLGAEYEYIYNMSLTLSLKLLKKMEKVSLLFKES